MHHTTPRPTLARPMQPELINAIAGPIADAVIAQLKQRMTAPTATAPVAARSPWATVEEAATFLRCKPQRVYDLLSSGQLRRHKEGGRVLIKRSDLELRVEAAQRVLTGARRATGRA